MRLYVQKFDAITSLLSDAEHGGVDIKRPTAEQCDLADDARAMFQGFALKQGYEFGLRRLRWSRITEASCLAMVAPMAAWMSAASAAGVDAPRALLIGMVLTYAAFFGSLIEGRLSPVTIDLGVRWLSDVDARHARNGLRRTMDLRAIWFGVAGILLMLNWVIAQYVEDRQLSTWWLLALVLAFGVVAAAKTWSQGGRDYDPSTDSAFAPVRELKR